MIDLKDAFLSREPAECILIDGKPEKIQYLASGASCLVYTRADGSIIKEFFPVFSGYKPVLAREKRAVPVREPSLESCPSSEREVLIDYLVELPILDKDRTLRDAYERCKMRFSKNVEIAQEVERAYRKQHGNMSVTQNALSVGDGIWQTCPYSGGQVLDEYLKVCRSQSDRKRFFRIVLSVIHKLINDTMIYHKSGYINLDIKHHNLYVVTGDVANADEGDIPRHSVASVRNLDFGSAMKISEIISYVSERAHELGYHAVREIRKEYFSTTERFYRESTIDEVIRLCVDPDATNAQKEIELKRLDAIAILKLMLYALSDRLGDEFSVTFDPLQDFLRENTFMDDTNILLEIMEDYMMAGTLFSSSNAFEDYDVYCRLYAMIYYVTLDKDFTLEVFSRQVEELLCILGECPYPQYEIPAPIREELQLHREWARVGKELLAENGIGSFEDIMKYCIKRSLLMPASPGEVFYSLLTGHAYEW